MKTISTSFLVRLLRKINHHRTTQVCFVGYPKTGNTWVRFMLGRYIQLICGLDRQPLFDATDVLGRCERACVGPAMHFTHRPLLWRKQTAEDLTYKNVIKPFCNKKVVLLARHPLDTEVSLWMQRKHQVGEGCSLGLEAFLDDPVWGLNKYYGFYSLWGLFRESVHSFFLLRYEDLRIDPEYGFRLLLEYLEIPVEEKILRRAVADAGFDKMKLIESSGECPTYRSSGLRIFATGNADNPDAFHVRRGKVGGYADYLDASDIKRYQRCIHETLPTFYGYGEI